MTDVFISYAKEDAQQIAPLARALELHGLEVFWDHKIPAGMRWRDYIDAALRAAKCVAVAWSESSLNSTWVKEEADHGIDRGILVPILLSPVKPPLGFGAFQAIDLSRWDGKTSAAEFQQLVRDIRRISGVESSRQGADRSDQPCHEHSKRTQRPLGKFERVWPLLIGIGLVAGSIAWLLHSKFRLSDAVGKSIISFTSKQPIQADQGSILTSESPLATADAVSQRPAMSAASHGPETQFNSVAALSEKVKTSAGRFDAEAGGAVGLYFDIAHTGGAFVRSVRPNSPGAAAGIRAGDLVTAINGHVILDGPEAAKLIRATSPGSQLTITIERAGMTLAFPAIVESFGPQEAEFLSSLMDVETGQPAREAIRKMNR